MKAILIILLGIAAGWFVLTKYIKKPSGLKPILPEVFFEPADDDQAILIDFSACSPGKEASSGSFGSVNIEMWSYDVGHCRFDYEYVGGGKASCLVPKDQGLIRFKKTSAGIDFGKISSFCSS